MSPSVGKLDAKLPRLKLWLSEEEMAVPTLQRGKWRLREAQSHCS